MGKATINFDLHEDQRRIWRNRKRRNTVRCGRKYGKSTLARFITLRGVEAYGKTTYIAPEYQYLNDWWEQLTEKYHAVIESNDKQNKRIRWTNGAITDLWSMDNLNAIRPHEYDLAIIDECALSRYFKEAWEQAIRPTLTKRRGVAWFLSTPKQGLGGPYFRELCQRADEAYAHFHAPSHANPFLPLDEIEEARRELPDLVFRQEYLAEFVEMEGQLVRSSMLRSDPHIPDGIQWHMGVDLAVSTSDVADYTAIVVVGIDKPSGHVYVRDVWRGQVKMHEGIRKVSEYAALYNPVRIYIEDNGFQQVFRDEMLRTTDLPVVGMSPKKMKTLMKATDKLDNDKVRRFMPLLARYEQGLVIHHPQIPQVFVDELLSFPPPKGKGHDDMVDALVYAWASAVKPVVTGAVWV